MSAEAAPQIVTYVAELSLIGATCRHFFFGGSVGDRTCRGSLIGATQITTLYSIMELFLGGEHIGSEDK